MPGGKQMNIFKNVKEQISVRDAAEYYGLKPNRAGMIVCPFHPDKNPSCKVDNRYYCFGCGAKGDVIDFVGNLFDLDAKRSAEKIATDFGLSADIKNNEKQIEIRQSFEKRKAPNKDEAMCLSDLVAYRLKLADWEKLYAPKSVEDYRWHPCFVKACREKAYIDYLIDELENGTEADKQTIIDWWKGGKIDGVNDSRTSQE